MLKSSTDTTQPVLAIGALILPATSCLSLTKDFLELKRRFFPQLTGKTGHELDDMRIEIKGSDLRATIRKKNRNARRHAFGFIDKILDLLEVSDAKLLAQIWIKPVGKTFGGVPSYTLSVQDTCAHFQHFLASRRSNGLIIADSRHYGNDIKVSHSVFTQQHQQKHPGNLYPNIIEAPVFGHSDNHAAIQITDILCSALMYPIASRVYCAGYVTNSHVDANDQRIKDRYAARLRAMGYRYKNGGGFTCGGIRVHDQIAKRSGGLFFS